MVNVNLMVGMPGSGKSTFVHGQIRDSEWHQKNAWISRDIIRELIVKDQEWNFQLEQEVVRQFKKEIASVIKLGYHSVFIDATHLTKGSRTKIINYVRSLGKPVNMKAIVMKTSHEECISRNLQREGKAVVPNHAMIRMKSTYVEPIMEEGFDEIIFVR